MGELTASGLSKKYRGNYVVDSVSFEVRSGEIVGLLGPNGAGKTTLFYMVVGLVEGDAGRVLLDGEDISHLPMHSRARRGIGYLPQETSVFRKLTVEDNLLVALEAYGGLGRSERASRLEKLLAEFHLRQIRSRYGIFLSGGERRRVEIARAFAVGPAFVLLDEPFAGVDPLAVADIKKLTRHLCDHGIGVLITDHNVRETLNICDRSYIVSEGQVIASGSTREVIANERVRQAYLGSDFRV